jgi:hypothetical protein
VTCKREKPKPSFNRGLPTLRQRGSASFFDRFNTDLQYTFESRQYWIENRTDKTVEV